MKGVALVTGSARRIGRAVVERLAREGYVVWVHYRSSASEAEAVVRGVEAAGGQARAVRADVSTADGIGAIVDAITARDGRLDVLVNNVGVYHTGALCDLPRAAFEEMLASNLLAPFELIRRCLPLMGEGAAVVNLGYVGVEHNGAEGKAAAYACSKAGLLILTRSYAEELGPRGVRVNMVSPGHVDNSVDLPAGFEARVPLRRAGRVDDICEAVAWLVGAGASYVTGQNLEVAGGFMMGLRPDR